MRSVLKPLLGGVLALGVALSASPALAVTTPPADPASETTLQVPSPEPEAPQVEEGETPTTESEPTENPGTTDPEVGTEDPEAVDPAVVDPDAADPADPEAPEVNADEEPTASGDPEGTETEDPNTEELAEVDPELLTEAPATLSLAGTIAVVAQEGPQLTGGAVYDGDTPPVDDGMTAGGVIVATDAGPIVPLDPALVGEDVETGDRFEGELTLDAEAQAAVEAEISEAGPLTVADALDAVDMESVASAASGATVAGSVVAAPVASAAAKGKSHPVDMVFFTGGKSPKDSDLKALVTNSSTYWKNQTNSSITGFSLKYLGKKPPKRNSKTLRCSEAGVNDMWGQAAKLFKRSAASYLTGGRHLVVIVDDNCGKASKGVAGLGTYGKSLHSGGMVWADIGQRGGGAVSKATGLVAHEIGHNLSLGHGNTRVCSGSANDSKQASSGRATSPCWDLEYGDMYNVMGFGSSFGGKTPPALPISQKWVLGVAPSGSVKTVKAAGGRSQTFTLQPGGKNSGLRGLRVESPTGGTYFVEYRNMSGADTGLGFTASRGWSLGAGTGPTYIEHQGVRLMKTHTTVFSGKQNMRTSTAISVRDTVYGRPGLNQTMRAGKKSTPWNSTARVTVVSTGASAKVRVDFTPFIDVPYAHKFGKEINWMSDQKLSTGNKAGGSLRKYAPSENVTREAMAAFLYRLKSPKGYTAPKKSPFKDVATNHKFYKQIAWMHSAGVAKGTKVKGGYIYEPRSSVTREAMAAFIYRFENSKVTAPKKSPFVDMKPGQKFYKQIAWMHSSGLSTGVKQKNGSKAYQPRGKVTREAMAAFIYRLKK